MADGEITNFVGTTGVQAGITTMTLGAGKMVGIGGGVMAVPVVGGIIAGIGMAAALIGRGVQRKKARERYSEGVDEEIANSATMREESKVAFDKEVAGKKRTFERSKKKFGLDMEQGEREFSKKKEDYTLGMERKGQADYEAAGLEDIEFQQSKLGRM